MRAILAALALCACAFAAHAETGIASVYSYGRHTASGARFDPRALTAAHRSLPFGTLVKVCRISGNCIVVKITDRGPYKRGRIIDLTPAAAKALGFTARGQGLAHVTVEPLGWTPHHGDFGGF